tara:strand:- start:21322 stop:22533 length:1212 start_codon:yes stop_codon:yes gene_type:complete
MKETLFIVVKASAGELHVALPIAYFLKKSRSLNVFFVFFGETSKKDLRLPDSYNNFINELGENVFGYSGVLTLWRERKSVFERTLIMTCDNGSVNLVDVLYLLSRKSLILFYHHAYALHGNEFDLVENKKGFPKDSVMLLNTSVDEVYYKKVGFSEENRMLVGAPGYSPGWINKLSSKEAWGWAGDKVIFVPMRAAHSLYLDQNSYDYLIDSLVKIFKIFKSYLFLVKFHPRQQNVEILERKFAALNNVQVVYCSTFEAALASDLTLSFWSSAITDSLACGTPCIEFHRHKVAHGQLVEREGRLVSLYRDLGLCEHFSDVEDLMAFLEGMNECTLKKMKESQSIEFRKIFMLDEGFEKEFGSVFGRLFQRVSALSFLSGSKVSAITRLALYSVKKMRNKFFAV